MVQSLTFEVPGQGPVRLDLRRALAAGYTGRDRALVQEHIDELAHLGVAPPKHVPMLFPLIPTLVTFARHIAVLGFDSTPEIEVVLFRTGGADYVGLGSDHTDRKVETVSIPLAKNVCPKPVAPVAWPVAEVAAHWDRLVLRSACGGVPLQEGPLAKIMPRDDLLAFVAAHDGPDHEGRMVFSGTVPTQAQPPRRAATIELALIDPVLGRRIDHAYSVMPMTEFFAD